MYGRSIDHGGQNTRSTKLEHGMLGAGYELYDQALYNGTVSLPFMCPGMKGQYIKFICMLTVSLEAAADTRVVVCCV